MAEMPNKAEGNLKEKLFLEKLAKNLGRPTPKILPARKATVSPDFLTKTKLSQEDLLQQFKVNAERLTVNLQFVSKESELQTLIGARLAEIRAESVICWDSPKLKQATILEACKSLGIKLMLWDHQADRQAMITQCASADVGITWADYGIAKTGSIAILSNPVQSRSVSLLPPIHIAILNKENIVPEMGDIFAKLDQTDLPSSLTFITGPSRTSDIEMDLTLGVHGPGKVFIFVLD